jgi:hypothetical protein
MYSSTDTLGTQNQGRFDGRSMQHAWETREFHTEFWPENLKERNRLEELGIDERIILEIILNK